jgi:photosystem II stability/assembly factor-like uncharacterized protein
MHTTATGRCLLRILHVPARRWTFAVLGVLALLAGTVPAAENKSTPPEFKHLKYRNIGPSAGGRICRVVGVPGDPLVYYTATASGGIWKSADAGLTWQPLFDQQPDASIGSIAVAPSNPNLIYAGAGEANIRGNVVVGHGIYKSTDAGKNWKPVWKQEGQIGTMVVHPTNPDIAFAAVLGHAFGPNPERGVYRTTDGGKSWHKVLYKDPDTGASDVCLDPSNPQIVYAGLWQARRQPWALTSGGPGSGLYVSRDGGDSWKQLGGGGKTEAVEEGPGKGLPTGIWGKIGVAVAPSDGRRVYALIEAEKGGLFRSDDGGENWRLVNSGANLRQRAWYYTTLTIDPKNADVVWCPQVSLLKSIDGGRTFQSVFGPHHGDHHDLWIDPANPHRMINGNDGGIDISTNGGESWTSPPLPISQFYHVAADNRTPYHVSGAMQDLGTTSGPSNSLAFGGIGPGDWYNVGGGEAGFTAPDPSDPNIVYAGEYGGYISRYDHRTRELINVSIYPFSAVGRGGAELRHRFQWTAPLFVSPHDAKTIYHAANVLFKSPDRGMHWTAISPDLTRNDKSKEQWTGGPITGDNTGAEIYCTIFAIAESPRQKDLLWAGSDDGLVHVSRDGGKSWTNVTANLKGLPEWGTVVCIEPSPFEAGSAYVVVDNHRQDDMRPYLWKTTDFGETWVSLTENLPPDVPLHAVREDPKRQGLLYLGTDRGVSLSSDGGATWRSLQLNLPTVPIHDLVVKDNDLVLASHGRSFWIFDDLTPIREMNPEIAGADLHLFTARDALRYRYHGGGRGRDLHANPPQGAILYYSLKAKPKGDVTLQILDAHGKLVRKLSSKPETSEGGGDEEGGGRRRFGGRALLPKEVGVNRVAWDLAYAGPTPIRGAASWPSAPTNGPLVSPGPFSIKLTVGGKTLTTSLIVKADPRTQLSAGDLEEELQLALALRDAVSQVTRTVKQIQTVRQQLVAKNELLKDNAKAKPLVQQSKELIGKLDALEGKLHNAKAKIPYDLLALKGGARLYSQLNNLLGTAMESDGPPTQGLREGFAEQSAELKRLEGEFKTLTGEDLAHINEQAKQLEIPSIVLPQESSKP